MACKTNLLWKKNAISSISCELYSCTVLVFMYSKSGTVLVFTYSKYSKSGTVHYNSKLLFFKL